MDKIQNVTRKEQIKAEIRIGDYDLVAEMLGLTRDAVKMRIRRNDSEALAALEKVIENRKELINNYQNQ